MSVTQDDYDNVIGNLKDMLIARGWDIEYDYYNDIVVPLDFSDFINSEEPKILIKKVIEQQNISDIVNKIEEKPTIKQFKTNTPQVNRKVMTVKYKPNKTTKKKEEGESLETINIKKSGNMNKQYLFIQYIKKTSKNVENSVGLMNMKVAIQLHLTTADSRKIIDSYYSLFILEEETTPSARIYLEKQRFTETIVYKMLRYNPTKHYLVRPHSKITLNNLKLLLKYYTKTNSLPELIKVLPKINTIDPIVVWNGWKIGDIIRIDRPKGVYYRVVSI
jgi:DNA-directed RNA polymerase subunit H (RpoH/RPB5)